MLLEYLDSINLVSINVILLFRSTMVANDGDESPNRDRVNLTRDSMLRNFFRIWLDLWLSRLIRIPTELKGELRDILLTSLIDNTRPAIMASLTLWQWRTGF